MYKISFKFCELRRLHLHDYHVGLKGKMVPFAGYEMPVQYPLGVLKEHLYCRESCGLFDVSHMGQLLINGDDQTKFIETLTTGEYATKKNGQSQLCLILNEKGGIIDDTIVAKRSNYYHMVVNAGNKFIVMDHIKQLIKQFNFKVDVEYLEDKPLIAIQGPNAHQVIRDCIDTNNEYNLHKLPFMNMLNINIKGIDYQINRCGYTGEDGYEVSIDKKYAQTFCEQLLKQGMSKFCGLGARDSLRLEAGLCLHGHEMDDTVNPYQAKLMWTVRKKNKETNKYNESSPYYGRTELLKQQKTTTSKRMGFIVDKAILRPPLDLLHQNTKVGTITSGTYSPILKKAIGFAFVDNEYAKEGTILSAIQRDQQVQLTLTPTPFIPAKYYRGP